MLTEEKTRAAFPLLPEVSKIERDNRKSTFENFETKVWSTRALNKYYTTPRVLV